VEKLDNLDKEILSALGYAVARSQLLEHSLLKLLEVQRHDLTLPLEERWAEIQRWMTRMTAGAAANELRLPEAIIAELKNAVERRNLVVHQVWSLYLIARRKRGDAAGRAYLPWLREQAAVLGRAYNGVLAINNAARQIAPARLSYEITLARWRTRVAKPITAPELPPEALPR
jgi:hypothetical protein